MKPDTWPNAPDALTEELSHYAHGRVPRDLRRRQVLAVAEELFVERGYQNTSMDELADRVGVSKPVIYDLGGSKEQVFQIVMSQVADGLAHRIATAVRAEPDPFLRLHAGSLAFFTFVEECRDAWTSLLAGDAGPVNDAVAALRVRQATLVAELLAEGAVEAGVTYEPVHIEAAAYAINGAFESLAAWWPSHPELHAEEMAALLAMLVGPGLGAMGVGAVEAGVGRG